MHGRRRGRWAERHCRGGSEAGAFGSSRAAAVAVAAGGGASGGRGGGGGRASLRSVRAAAATPPPTRGRRGDGDRLGQRRRASFGGGDVAGDQPARDGGRLSGHRGGRALLSAQPHRPRPRAQMPGHPSRALARCQRAKGGAAVAGARLRLPPHRRGRHLPPRCAVRAAAAAAVRHSAAGRQGRRRRRRRWWWCWRRRRCWRRVILPDGMGRPDRPAERRHSWRARVRRRSRRRRPRRPRRWRRRRRRRWRRWWRRQRRPARLPAWGVSDGGACAV